MSEDVEDIVMSLPLFDGEPPLELTGLERALQLRFDAAKIEAGTLTLDGPSPAITSVRIGYDRTFESVGDVRRSRVSACSVLFAGAVEVAEARLAARTGAPFRVLDDGGTAYDRYGPFFVEVVEEGAPWHLVWYGALPEWAVVGVDNSARTMALQELARSLATKAQIERPRFASDTGIVVDKFRAQSFHLELKPAISGLDLAIILELGRVVGVPSEQSEEEWRPPWLAQLVEENETLLVFQRPQVGGWTIAAQFEAELTGKELGENGASDLLAKDVVRGLTFQLGDSVHETTNRINCGFVQGREADQILELGRNCFTGSHLPDAVFAAQAVRFCWQAYAPNEMWLYLSSLASTMGDRDIFSIAPGAWFDAKVGVARIPTYSHEANYRDLIAARAEHGEPPIVFMFGMSRAWAIVIDRNAGLAVTGVIRPFFHFNELRVNPSITLNEAIELACSTVPAESRAAYAEQMRKHYADGSWD